MTVERAKVRRARMQAIGRPTRYEVRTSDVVLAVVGVALLAGLCLVGLANLVGEAQGLAALAAPGSTETL